jgi:lysophospholipase L1-like esterase
MCPAAQTLPSPTGQPLPVTYAPPTAAGGTAPITTTCAPPSGVSFPIGSTGVTCNAVDVNRQTASCNFSVTVTAPPRTSVTRYVAFGDSITEGFPHAFRPELVDPPPVGSYPAVLEALIKARYTSQVIKVLDEGVGGEIIADGLRRLPVVLNFDMAGALLLVEGANDLNQFGSAGIAPAISGLRQMVRNGQGRSMIVFVGTLLPERANGTPPRASHPELVVPANDAIRSMAAAEGAVLVDLYQAFGGTPDPLLIGSDGLHPTTAGNERIAQTFFTAIRARLELPATSGLSWYRLARRP